MSRNLTLEVCVDSLESAVAAECGGAHRVELCSNLLEGGVTPSAGLISAVRAAISIDLYVMVRPRGGDFHYSKEEREIIKRDISVAKDLGATGIVFGSLLADGSVDVECARLLVGLSDPLAVTFHRAFDMSADLFRSLRALRDAGVHKILTSGGKQTAGEGAETLAGLVKAASGEPEIIAASGIDEHNVASLIEKTGVTQIHATARASFPSAMLYQNREVSMGAARNSEYERLITTEDKVRRLLQAALKTQSKL